MYTFTNNKNNGKIKEDAYENSQKSNSNNEGISRFLYEGHQQETEPKAPQNNYYYPVNNSLQTKPFSVAPKADNMRTSTSYNGLNQKSEISNIYKTSDNLYKKTPEIKPYSNNFNTPKNDRVYDNAYDAYKENPKTSYPKATVKKENLYDDGIKATTEKSYSNTNAAKYLSESFGEYLKQNQKRHDANLKVIQDSISSLQKKNKTISDSQTRRATPEDIYTPETLIASPENLRSDVSLYGKSPVDMNKKYSYENGELKVSTDNDYPLIAKANSFKYDTNNLNSLHDRIKSSNNTNMLDKLKEKENKAKAVIQTNKHHILNAANKHGVNPGILASTIYAEQARNVNLLDDFDIYRAHKDDVSLGIGQIKISTAMLIEDAGYMEKTVPQMNENGEIITNRRKEIINKLTDPAKNIEYAAAYLSMIRDLWKDSYPEIGGRTAIMATLYNIGANGSKGPHSNPQSNDFGDFAKEHYYDMLEILNN